MVNQANKNGLMSFSMGKETEIEGLGMNKFHAPERFIEKHVKNLFETARGSHAWDHTLRVNRLCERIGLKEGADIAVLRMASYLHDIGRCRQDMLKGAVCHAEQGARMAKKLIDPFDLSLDRKKNIIHCIRCHRFRGENRPKTLEAKVLFDADKLDAIGAVGVARAFLFAGEVGARLHNSNVRVEDTKPYSLDDTGYREFKIKLCKIKDRILTNEGKRIAVKRHAFMVKFFKRFLEEYEGER